MLPRSRRVVSGGDYRRIVRSGKRTAGFLAVVYRVESAGSTPRFGFIVSKAVGNAVTRNRVRRRLKAIAASAAPQLPPGAEIVVRALPGSAEASWVTLNSEITEALTKGKTRV